MEMPSELRVGLNFTVRPRTRKASQLFLRIRVKIPIVGTAASALSFYISVYNSVPSTFLRIILVIFHMRISLNIVK